MNSVKKSVLNEYKTYKIMKGKVKNSFTRNTTKEVKLICNILETWNFEGTFVMYSSGAIRKDFPEFTP